MSQVFTCPVESMPGTITLPDGLTLKQMAEWEEVLSKFKHDDTGRLVFDTADAWLIALPVVARIVEKWEVAGAPGQPTIDNTVFAPYRQYRQFTKWVINCVSALFLGEKDIPKVLGGPSQDG